MADHTLGSHTMTALEWLGILWIAEFIIRVAVPGL